MSPRFKYKIKVSRPDGSTVHGVMRANSRSEATESITLPPGFFIHSIEDVPINHACFYDTEFDLMLKAKGQQ